MTNYTLRVHRFSALTSLHCLWCRIQARYNQALMKGHKYEVPEDKLLDKPFFGVEHGPKIGSMLGTAPKDFAFQKAVYKAMIAHSRDVHPQNITVMIRLGWIKK